jgi:hypothetical protein
MKATLKKSEGLKKEFEVTVPAAEIQKRVSVELALIGAKAKIPGAKNEPNSTYKDGSCRYHVSDLFDKMGYK